MDRSLRVCTATHTRPDGTESVVGERSSGRRIQPAPKKFARQIARQKNPQICASAHRYAARGAAECQQARTSMRSGVDGRDIATKGALMETTGYGNTGNNGNNTGGLSTGTGEGTLNKLSSSAHQAVDSLASTADEAARKVKPKIDKVTAMAHDAVDKAAGAASQTADKLTAKR